MYARQAWRELAVYMCLEGCAEQHSRKVFYLSAENHLELRIIFVLLHSKESTSHRCTDPYYKTINPQVLEEGGQSEGIVNYNRSMERRVKIQYTCDEAESMVKQHQCVSHPEIQCQCLECLYAREILAQCKVWKTVP